MDNTIRDLKERYYGPKIGIVWVDIYAAEDAFYSHCTEAFSVLEMFQDDTLYKLTYLLIY